MAFQAKQQAPAGTVLLHGKEYRTVALRVEMFRKDNPTWTIDTIGISFDDPVLFRCEIRNDEGRLLATGHSEERRSNTGINSTSAVENCETGAIGRALAALGYGGSEFASADELVGALQKQQQSTTEPKPAIEVTPELEKARRRFHAIGVELHGKNWDAKRHEIIEKETKGKATSTNDLNVEWLNYLADGLQKKLNAQLDASAS